MTRRTSKKKEILMTRTQLYITGILLITLPAGLVILSSRTSAGGREVIVYSGRNEAFILPLLTRFEKETGINVRLLTGSATSFAHRLAEEAHRPQADVFLANDAGIMEYARQQGVLTPIRSDRLNEIPSDFRAGDNTWTGLSGRARVLMYHRDLIDEADMPQSIFDLADPRYRGQFAITRSGNASMVSQIAAIRNRIGDEATIEFLRKLLANQPVITGGHTEIRRMVGAGEVKFGWVNDYYYHLQLHEPRNNRVAAVYPDQGADQMGVFVNVAGLALVANSPNPENARKLAHFLLAPEQQKQFSLISKELPLLPGMDTPDYARGIDQYRRSEMPLDQLGSVWSDTLDLMEKAGY
jgi:iron(III) transport system substrate-binding protein